MPRIDKSEPRQLFILRRAFWLGQVRRSDVVSAWDVSASQAYADMADAIRTWPDFLELTGKGRGSAITPRHGCPVPAPASSETIFRLLEAGQPESITGIPRRTEKPGITFIDRRHHAYLPPADILDRLLRSLILGLPLRLLYTGMRRGESARWRPVTPCGIDRSSQRWRLYGLTPEGKMRTFVLSRISGIDSIHDADGKMPRPVSLSRTGIRYQVALNPDLTESQRQAAEHDLDIRNGCITIPEMDVFEFLLANGRAKVDSAAVCWPVIVDMKREQS